MSKLMSSGNHKLPKTTKIFNLPAVRSCPGSTAECRKFCYARKAERMYPQVLPFRMKNLEISKSPDFVSLISAELKASRKVDTVRIHESGDFYNQEYVDKWIEIAKLFPSLKFYAYTKSAHLDFSRRPDNFIVLLSDDHEILKNYWFKFDGVASVTVRGDRPKPGWFVCPGDCRKCHYCYDDHLGKRVTFLEH